jgi:uncharacterized membrane protein YkoI
MGWSFPPTHNTALKEVSQAALMKRAGMWIAVRRKVKRRNPMIEARKILIGVAAALVIAGVATAIAISSEEANESAIELSQVPSPARDAAKKLLGGTVREAKVIEQNGQKIYELEGQNSSGQKMSIHVNADGTVVALEKDDD